MIIIILKNNNFMKTIHCIHRLYFVCSDKGYYYYYYWDTIIIIFIIIIILNREKIKQWLYWCWNLCLIPQNNDNFMKIIGCILCVPIRVIIIIIYILLVTVVLLILLYFIINWKKMYHHCEYFGNSCKCLAHN